jgi:rhodanese-related sulfurtransferase
VRAERRYDPESREKVYAQSGVNPSFITDVEKAFPDKNAKIMVVCGDGRTRATRAVELMRAAGYENVVRLEGGFNLWARAWDQVRAIRRSPYDRVRAARVDP